MKMQSFPLVTGFGLAVALCCSPLHTLDAATRTAGLLTPGSAIPPEGGLLRLGGTTLAADEDFLRCAVSDPAGGYAWFGCSTTPGQVIKVAYDGPNGVPRRVASLILDLEPGEDSLFTGVIDTNAGFAYFGTFTSPGRVIKVALGAGNTPPVRLGAVTLMPDEIHLFASVIDPAAGYAYFGTRTAPGRVVKVALGLGTNPPTRIGAVTLSFGEDLIRSAVIDPGAGYAWFGTFSIPGRVVKVALGASNEPPSRVDGIALNFGEDKLTSAVIDRAARQAWFGTYTAPGRVVKVDLGAGDAPPSRLDAVMLDPGEDFLACAAGSIAVPGRAFFGCDTLPGAVVKVALGAGNDPPAREGAVTLPTGEENLISAADAGGAVWFGGNTQPGQVIQIGAGAAGQPPVREGALELGRGENDLQSVVIDAVNGYGWFGAATFPGQIIKVRLGRAGQPPQRIATLSLNPGEDRPICAVADIAGGYAWFGTDTGPGRVVKVALGSGDAPPTRVGALTLNASERFLRCAVIDLTNRYAYFGTAVVAPGRVIKVALGAGNNLPTRVGAATFNADEWDFQSAVIDGARGQALFGTSQYLSETGATGKVVKVTLGVGNNPPARVGALALLAEEQIVHSIVGDPSTGFAWCGVSDLGKTKGDVIKVSFEAGNAPPRRVGAVPFASGEVPGTSAAAIDVVAGYAIFGGAGSPDSHLVKVALGAGEDPPARVGAIPLLPRERSLHCGTGDPVNGLSWFGTSTGPGNVVLASYSQKGFIKGTRLVLTESGALTNLNFYSHRALGTLRLALYAQNGTNHNLLWQSGVIANTINGGWIVAPISQGTPSTLQLSAGTYDLCWQVDTTADVPSYVGGIPGDGFRVPADFGAFPAVLAGGVNGFESTSETWAAYVAYDVPKPVIISIIRTNDVAALVWLSNPGTLYQVQACTILPPPAWTDLGLPVQATNTTTTWSEIGAGGMARFYRLVLP